jgi:hypothetical protein
MHPYNMGGGGRYCYGLYDTRTKLQEHILFVYRGFAVLAAMLQSLIFTANHYLNILCLQRIIRVIQACVAAKR